MENTFSDTSNALIHGKTEIILSCKGHFITYSAGQHEHVAKERPI